MTTQLPVTDEPSFPTAQAEYFEDKLHGRNEPVLVGCTAQGDAITCVVKLFHRLEIKTCYWNEWVAGLIGHQLGINLPEQLVVEISRDVAQAIGEQLGEDASASATACYGTRYITPNIQLPIVSGALEADLREAGAELAAFDVLIDNEDRIPTNPNLIIDARSPRRLVAIDHDLAFRQLYRTREREPWPLGILRNHALTGRFGTNKPDLGRIRRAIAELSDSFLDALPDRTPLDAHPLG